MDLGNLHCIVMKSVEQVERAINCYVALLNQKDQLMEITLREPHH